MLTFTIFLGFKDQQWYWRALSRNRQIVAVSGEGYTRRRDAKRSVDRFLNSTYTPSRARRWSELGIRLRCEVGR